MDTATNDLKCLGDYTGVTCDGDVEYRFALTGRSFPRCDEHWAARLAEQERIDATYPQHAPADFDPGYAGEHWDEDY